MDRTTTIILLAFASLVLAAMATAIFLYVVVPWRRQRRLERKKAIIESAQVAHAPEPPESSIPVKRSSNVKQHSLFIIFDQPSKDSDERLATWLRSKGAHYEPFKKVFLIDGHQPANPITIANAFLPGELPDLLREGGGSETIKGISLIVKPPLRKRRNQQVIVFVDIAKEASTLFNANVLDTDHQTATENTYAEIIGG